MDQYVNINGLYYRTLTREEKRKRLNELDNEVFWRWAYIPFVIAEGVWDYADTVINIAIQMRLVETKPLSRAIRNLRRSYEQKRNRDAFGGNRKGEMENFIGVEDLCPKTFNYICKQIRSAAKRTYPELGEEYVNLLVAVYECYYLLSVLFKYTEGQNKIICEKCQFDSVGNILPDELYKLQKLILEFCGDKQLKVVGHGLFTYNLVKILNQSTFYD